MQQYINPLLYSIDCRFPGIWPFINFFWHTFYTILCMSSYKNCVFINVNCAMVCALTIEICIHRLKIYLGIDTNTISSVLTSQLVVRQQTTITGLMVSLLRELVKQMFSTKVVHTEGCGSGWWESVWGNQRETAVSDRATSQWGVRISWPEVLWFDYAHSTYGHSNSCIDYQ